MAKKTQISWCDSTFNPWVGCTQISPACDHCYASAQMDTRLGRVKWGAGQPRKVTSEANWKMPLRWNKHAFWECLCGWRGADSERPERYLPGGSEAPCCPACGSVSGFAAARRRVFCASLADWLDNEVPVQWLWSLLNTIRLTPNIDWLLLTKRIQNWFRRIDHARMMCVMMIEDGATGDLLEKAEAMRTWLAAWLDGNPPANVWLGATICDQPEADRDILKLLPVPARVRFLSIEPLLGHVELNGHEYSVAPGLGEGVDWLTGVISQHSEIFGGDTSPWLARDLYEFPKDAREPRIHWVICGGESGPGARPMHPDWVRSLRDQCANAGVPFHFKQWGEWLEMDCAREILGDDDPRLTDGQRRRGGRARLTVLDREVFVRCGHRDAGRLLDGVTHDGFPGEIGCTEFAP